LIEAVAPDVLVKGGDYRVETIVGAGFVVSRGGRVLTLPLVPGRSTSKAIERMQQPSEKRS
jgi:D-beta-D-heptose 7-phosphate kinase/D-beta-D-heptose 1-phosphate adenosyltransferase